MKIIYIILCIAGIIAPFYSFFPFMETNGLDMIEFVRQAIENDVAAFLTGDLVVSSVVFWFFIYNEVKKYKIKLWWMSLLGNFLIGLSFAFPLFLLLRHIRLEEIENETKLKH